MEGSLVLTPGLLTMAFLELIKWAWRKFVIKTPEYDFPPYFYELMLPFLTFGFSILLSEVGWAAPITWDWMGLVQWALAIVASLALYILGVKPLKEYRKAYYGKA